MRSGVLFPERPARGAAHRHRLMPESPPSAAGSPRPGGGASDGAPRRGSPAASATVSTPACPARKPSAASRRSGRGLKRSRRWSVSRLLGQQPAGRSRPATAPPANSPGARPHQPTSCRATSACARVTPSTYSRSPPMGSPRARRVTRTPMPREQLLDVGGRHLALHGWIGRQDDLPHRALPHPVAPAGPAGAPPGRRRRAARAGRRARGSGPGSRSRGPPRATVGRAPRPRRARAGSRRGSRQMAQGWSSVRLPHSRQGRTRSATATSAAASRPTCSGGCCSR